MFSYQAVIFNEVKSNIARYPYLVEYLDGLTNETDPERLVDLIVKIIKSKQVI